MTYVECNVGNKAAVDAAIETCAEHGRIDVLANVAGIVQFGRIETVTEDEWDRVHAVDLKGPFFLIQAALPHIRAAKGNIVNVSSVAGNVAAALRHGVRRRQGRADPAHQGARAGAVARGHPRQRDLPRHRGHPDRRRRSSTSSPTTSTPGSPTG